MFRINPFQWQRHSSKNCWQLSWLMSLRHRAESCFSKTEDPCSVHKQQIFGSKNDPSSWKMKKKTFENFPDLFPGEINLVPPKTYTPDNFFDKISSQSLFVKLNHAFCDFWLGCAIKNCPEFGKSSTIASELLILYALAWPTTCNDSRNGIDSKSSRSEKKLIYSFKFRSYTQLIPCSLWNCIFN